MFRCAAAIPLEFLATRLASALAILMASYGFSLIYIHAKDQKNVDRRLSSINFVDSHPIDTLCTVVFA